MPAHASTAAQRTALRSLVLPASAQPALTVKQLPQLQRVLQEAGCMAAGAATVSTTEAAVEVAVASTEAEALAATAAAAAAATATGGRAAELICHNAKWPVSRQR